MYLGLNNKSSLLVFLMVCTVPALSQQARDQKYLPGSGMESIKVSSAPGSITINYSIPEPEAAGFTDENGKWYRVSIPGHIAPSDIGKPGLPVFSRLVQIPEGASWKIKISDVRSSRIKPSAGNIRGSLYPVQEGETKDQVRRKPPFRIDSATYSKRGYLRHDTVKIVPVGRARGMNLATLTISPAAYNPRTKDLEVITAMKVEVVFTGEKDTGRKSTTGSPLFKDNLSKGILNYEPDDLMPGYTDKPVRMIILTDTAFRKHLEPFIRWKRQKGFSIDLLYKGAAYAGVNYTDIKNSIAAIYNSATTEKPAPEYLLIVGNTTMIPYYGTGNVTDMYYGEFDGNGDYIPEMYTGRLPVSDTNELKSVVSKIVQYEKYEFADTNLYHRNALATAGTDASHATYMNGQVNYLVSNYLTPDNNIREKHYLYPAISKDTIIKHINNGLSLINYTGHGASNGWLYVNLTNADTIKLKNKNMYPLIISNACLTSRFNTNSFGNTMVLAKNKGAVGYIGASNDSYWDEDIFWAVGLVSIPPPLNPTYELTGLGAFDRLFHTHGESASEWYTSMGQIIYAGNMAVMASTSTRKKYYWEIYNLVGDPSVIPVVGTPGTFSTTLPDTLPNGLRSFTFTGDPYSYVAVSHFDTLWDASFVTPSGAVTLDLPGLSDDSCLVVITGQNKKPLIKTIYFSTVNEPYINLSSTSVTDSLGNSNGAADYNETLFLKLKIGNLGSEAAASVNAVLTTSSPFINIIDGSASIGTLLPATEKILYNDLKFNLTGQVPDNSAATFDLKLTNGTEEKIYKIDVILHSPELEISNYIIDDTGTGNGNYIAESGETVKLTFSITNKGSSPASGIFFISSLNSEITLLEASKSSGVLLPGASVVIPLEVKVSSSAAPGAEMVISSEMNCDPYFANRSFSFRIGKFQETFESSSLKIFPWINLSAKPWTILKTDSYEGITAARSGAISHNQSSSLQLKAYYPAADSLRFYYKVSSETNYDHLSFRLNDSELLKKSGETGWNKATIGVPAGVNKFEWIYRKDGSVSSGSDCAMLDLVDFAKTVPVNYIARDIKAHELISPVQKTEIGLENVTLKLLNLGPDTIYGFNMAYRVNDLMPVIQHFNDTLIYGGDTVTVTFKTKADLSAYGDHNLVVFSFGNSDDYLYNDSLKSIIKNRARRVRDIARPDEQTPAMVGPNPFSGELRIMLESMKSDTIYISLINSAGKRIIHRSEYHLAYGVNTIRLSGEALEPAIYYLIIERSDYTDTRKVIKLKQ